MIEGKKYNLFDRQLEFLNVNKYVDKYSAFNMKIVCFELFYMTEAFFMKARKSVKPDEIAYINDIELFHGFPEYQLDLIQFKSFCLVFKNLLNNVNTKELS
jgi:hypothetical protein